MSDATPVRILLVEDDPEDVRIFSRYAGESELYDIKLHHAAAPDEALRCLKEGQYDLVFLDLRLGAAATGVDVLRLMAQAGHDLPAIILTGTGDEQMAVEVMKVGATDYLIKDTFNSQVLERSIRYGLEQHRSAFERRKAEAALRKSEEKYRELVENANSIIMRRKVDGEITFFNEFAQQFFGYKEEEVLGRNVVGTIVPPVDTSGCDLAAMIQNIGRNPEKYATNQNENVRRNGERVWVAWTNKAIRDEQGRVTEMLCVGNDITERRLAEEELRRTLAKLRQALGATIRGMALTVEVRDPYTAGHQRDVANLARAIGTEMGLLAEQIDGIRMAGAIHDLGKVHVPAEILSKPGQLSDLEFSLIKTHCAVAYEILRTIDFPWPVAEIVYQHHERMDGSGYPRALRGDQILMEARVIAVADVVQAMLSHRPYRPPLATDSATREISENRGTLYDADVVDACLKLLLEEGV